jgi:hypothetical protein
VLIKILVDGKHRRLGVQRVENGLHQQEIRPASHQAVDGLGIARDQFIKADIAVTRVVHIRADAGGTVGGPQHAGAEARLGRILCGLGNTQRLHQLGRRVVDLPHQAFHPVVGHGNRRGIESVGFNDVGPGIQIRLMNAAYHVRPGQHQQVVVAFYVTGPVGKPLATVIRFLQRMALDHGAHAAIQDQDALGQLGKYRMRGFLVMANRL